MKKVVKTETFTWQGQDIISHQYTRGGLKSPKLIIYEVNGIKIYPFEYNRSGLSKVGLSGYNTMQFLFSEIYGPHLTNFIYNENPLLRSTPKNHFWGSSVIIPFLKS